MSAKTLADLSAADEAKRLVNELLRLESRGPGDLEGAMRRIGNRYGIPWRTLWAIRYRTPRDVFVGVFEKIKEAHRAECRRQIERMAHELQIARSKGVHVEDLEDQVRALRDELEACVANRRNGEA